jgi:endo-1,4-beta-xylanase
MRLSCKSDLLFVFLLALSLCAPCPAQSLRQEADRIGILVGTAVNPRYLSEPAYASTLAREFNLLEPEDAMKWTAIRPDERTFDFTDADQLVAFAELHGMKVRGHNLVWGTHNPKWLAEGHFTAKQLSALLHEHIRCVVGRYRGKVFAWDVVNEAFDQNGKLRDSIWYDRPGIDLAGRGTAYIERAFRWAHASDPHALLFYNDAEGEAINDKSDAIYAMVKDFKRRGVPIDGVGLQMHIFNLDPDVNSISANIERFTKLGVQIHITEMDVALPVDSSGNPVNPADLSRQAEIYRRIATACLQHPGCTAFQTWGFTDKYSWIGWFTHGSKGNGLPFDRRYKPKPAYEALHRAFAERLTR